MKKTLATIVLLLLGIASVGNALADDRHHHYSHSSVGVGIALTPYWGPWYPPSPFYSPPYYPPVIIERPAPPVYIEQAPQVPAPATAYWYYCRSANGYHPYVKECPEGWMKVLPQSPANP